MFQYFMSFIDISMDEKLRLQELQQLANSTTNWRTLPDTTLDAMVLCVEESRLRQRQGIRSNRLARGQSIKKTADHITGEVLCI